MERDVITEATQEVASSIRIPGDESTASLQTPYVVSPDGKSNLCAFCGKEIVTAAVATDAGKPISIYATRCQCADREKEFRDLIKIYVTISRLQAKAIAETQKIVRRAIAVYQKAYIKMTQERDAEMKRLDDAIALVSSSEVFREMMGPVTWWEKDRLSGDYDKKGKKNG